MYVNLPYLIMISLTLTLTKLLTQYFFSETVSFTSTLNAFFSASVSIVLTATTNLCLYIALETTPNAPLPTVCKATRKFKFI